MPISPAEPPLYLREGGPVAGTLHPGSGAHGGRDCGHDRGHPGLSAWGAGGQASGYGGAGDRCSLYG